MQHWRERIAVALKQDTTRHQYNGFKRGAWGLRLIPLVGVVALALVFAAVVHADSTPITYYACVNNSSGTIHMASATDSCSTGSQMISWNQVGPAGPAGPVGATGPLCILAHEGGTYCCTSSLREKPIFVANSRRLKRQKELPYWVNEAS